MGITKTQIKKWNTHFNSLTKAQKRVEIAKDVIKQIKLGKYEPKNWGYANFDDNLDLKLDVQSNFDKITECNCCMLGNCLLSLTKFQNNLKFHEISSGFQVKDSKVSKMLKSVFTPYQQALLEACFENGDCTHAEEAYDCYLKDEDYDKCTIFYSRYNSAKARVIAAMENIIANNGTFKP